MQKIILDTNVLISALIQRNYPNFILYNCIIESSVELCLSDDLLAEYIEVIHRPKFNRYPEFIKKAEFVITQIAEKSKKYKPTTIINIINDIDDNKLLELAVESKADFIITGNTNDFTITEYNGTKIITPKDYWENYRFE
jgi:uncharacterized protein